MTRSNDEKSRDKRFSRFTILLLGIILTGATLTLASTAVKWSFGAEAQLVFAGGSPRAPLFQVKTENGKHFFYITSRPIFKNTGSKSGAVRRVNVVAADFTEPFPELKVLYLDRSEIAARETKEVRCEFVAVLDAAVLDPTSRLEFRVHFYGPNDQEFYWEAITIENIAGRSTLPRLRSREFTPVHSSPAGALKPSSRFESL